MRKAKTLKQTETNTYYQVEHSSLIVLPAIEGAATNSPGLAGCMEGESATERR